MSGAVIAYEGDLVRVKLDERVAVRRCGGCGRLFWTVQVPSSAMDRGFLMWSLTAEQVIEVAAGAAGGEDEGGGER